MIRGRFKKMNILPPDGCKTRLSPELYFYGPVTHGTQDCNQCGVDNHTCFREFRTQQFFFLFDGKFWSGMQSSIIILSV